MVTKCEKCRVDRHIPKLTRELTRELNPKQNTEPVGEDVNQSAKGGELSELNPKQNTEPKCERWRVNRTKP